MIIDNKHRALCEEINRLNDIISELKADNLQLKEEVRYHDRRATSQIEANDGLHIIINEKNSKIQELERKIDIKDQIISTLKIENAKQFHQLEKIKKVL